MEKVKSTAVKKPLTRKKTVKKSGSSASKEKKARKSVKNA
jgi:hypothetical protein